jgi:pimeloyl-ACP methyl ester carboxylesterase
MYGGELGLSLSPLLASLNRRAVFYDTHADIPFIAEWTNLVFSRDIDAVVAAADATVKNHNVFLGGHSAGTGFTARYASTDLNLSGAGTPAPGYAKLRGLVLLEGIGRSTGNVLSDDTLDRIEAKFLGRHPNPANDRHLKTGQRDARRRDVDVGGRLRACAARASSLRRSPARP